MRLTEEKLTYLLFLYTNRSGKDTVTSMANRLGVSKSTLSRVLQSFYEEGWMEVKGKGTLSQQGMGIARKLQLEIDKLACWLISEGGLKYDEAYHEAKSLVLTMREDTREKLVHRSSLLSFYKAIENVKHLHGDFLCANLEDGIYTFAFTVYKDQSNDLCAISMANEGFAHPGYLRINQGKGQLCLRVKELEHESMIGKLVLKGKLSHLKYCKDGVFLDAQEEKDCFCIPVNSMTFYYNKEECVMQGSIRLKMRADVGVLHMPERTAVMIVYFK